MHLVMKIAQRQCITILDQQGVKTGMRRDSRQRLMLHVEQDQHRVRRDYKMNENGAEKQQMFHRMHRQARPWTNAGVSMVKGVGHSIQWRPVQQAMNPIEMK